MRREIPATGVVTRRYRLTMDVAVQTEGLRKSFGSTKALDGLDLAVPEGTILGLLGPNGAGKTTAVRILTTLLIPDAGRAVVAGVDVLAQPTKARRLMGLTGQFAAVDDYLTGRENLIMFGRLYHLSRAEAKRRADELLERFDLTDAAGRLAKTYSGGMRRRLDIASSLVFTAPGYATPVKTRILGGGAHASKQQMVRIDKITHLAERDAARRRVMRALRGVRGRVDGVLVSDYGLSRSR